MEAVTELGKIYVKKGKHTMNEQLLKHRHARRDSFPGPRAEMNFSQMIGAAFGFKKHGEEEEQNLKNGAVVATIAA